MPHSKPSSAPDSGPLRELILVTGMSGSGKSVALHALEDVGFNCVDNLPPELLPQLVELERSQREARLAIAIDVRSANALHLIPLQLTELRARGWLVKTLFLDAYTDVLVRRFSETRRKHPLTGHAEWGKVSVDKSNSSLSASLSSREHVLIATINRERELLGELRDRTHVIDTSLLRPAQLQSYVKTLVSAPTAGLTLVFESFAFKRGVPLDADFVFDARMLPNPHYEAGLRELTGHDAPVQNYLAKQPTVAQMESHIASFLQHWLPEMARDHRSYVTVAVGCTGGQHRSVYLVERLATRLEGPWLKLRRHRELSDRA